MRFKSAFLSSLFFLASMAVAQANNLPIPVSANESITVTLFFPSEIKKVIEPALNYKFEYERDGTMGTLVARKGATSNLTVITKDGSIFSFLLQYEQEVANFTYVLSAEEAIGTMAPTGMTSTKSTSREKEAETVLASEPEVTIAKGEVEKQKGTPKKTEREPLTKTVRSNGEDNNAVVSDLQKMDRSEAVENGVGESNLYDTDRESYYDIFCENNYDQENRLKKDFKAGDGIELQLNSITADKNEFYFIFQMTNRLTSRFNAEELRFYVRTSRGDAPLQMNPVHIFNHQEFIEAGRTRKMVYVLEDFRLSKDQKVYVVLNEKDGDRDTVLKIGSRTINTLGEKSIATAR